MEDVKWHGVNGDVFGSVSDAGELFLYVYLSLSVSLSIYLSRTHTHTDGIFENRTDRQRKYTLMTPRSIASPSID